MGFIAWWGAGLSTLLALVKLWELWRDRFRLDVGYNFASIAEVGNEIYIRNLARHAIILSFWELRFCSGCWPRRKVEPINCADLDAGDIRIEPHSSCTLYFQEEHHFEWRHKALNGRRIYIVLHIAGALLHKSAMARKSLMGVNFQQSLTVFAS
ncbi:hypothetical protein ACQUJO_11580 [Ralstonia pseudosolanacearum]